MIKNNSYKLKNLLLINIILIIGILWLIIAIDFKKIIRAEIQDFNNILFLSSIIQIFDSGNIEKSSNIQFKDLFLLLNNYYLFWLMEYLLIKTKI